MKWYTIQKVAYKMSVAIEDRQTDDEVAKPTSKEKTVNWVDWCRTDDAAALAMMSPDSEEWLSQDLHLFIISDAGRPIYSRYGTTRQMAPFLCTCVAILAHMNSTGEKLSHFVAGSHIFVVLPKGPFVFIAVSKNALPVSYLTKQLSFLHSLFLSLFSERIINKIGSMPSYDFRHTADGTRAAWDGVVNNTTEDPAFVFEPSIPVARIPRVVRQTLTRRIENLGGCKAALVMEKNRVLAAQAKACDYLSLRLIVELVWTPAFSGKESWTPFFPLNSANRMYQLYISRCDEGDACFVVLCEDMTRMTEYHDAATAVFADLADHRKNKATIPRLEGPASVFYCWAVSDIGHGQIYVTDPDPEVFWNEDPKITAKNMGHMCTLLSKSCSMVESNGAEGEYMFKGERDIVVIWKGKDIEVYGVARSEDIPEASVSDAMTALKNYIGTYWNDIVISDYKFRAR